MKRLKELIVHRKPKSPVSEAYRSLRTNIEFANIDKDVKSIMVTSSKQGEGKTTTISNLAITMANMGKKVAIVDCDLRKPRIHKIFEVSNIGGMTDILLTHSDYKRYVKNTEINGLDIITAGRIPSNPSEILASKSMKKLLGEIKQDYDYLFIDAPPVAVVTDAAILSSYIDGVILVCSSGNVEIELAKSSKASLEKVGANMLGVVLNQMNVEGRSSYYAYYYRYYGDDEKKKVKKKKASPEDSIQIKEPDLKVAGND